MIYYRSYRKSFQFLEKVLYCFLYHQHVCVFASSSLIDSFHFTDLWKLLLSHNRFANDIVTHCWNNVITKNTNLSLFRCSKFYWGPPELSSHVLMYCSKIFEVSELSIRFFNDTCYPYTVFLDAVLLVTLPLWHQIQLWQSFSVKDKWWYYVKSWLLIQSIYIQ